MPLRPTEAADVVEARVIDMVDSGVDKRNIACHTENYRRILEFLKLGAQAR